MTAPATAAVIQSSHFGQRGATGMDDAKAAIAVTNAKISVMFIVVFPFDPRI